MRKTATGIFSAFVLGYAGIAVAAGISPGQVQKTLPGERALRPVSPAPGLPAAPVPAIPRVPEGGPGILIRHFEISGNTAIPTAELLGVISSYQGRKLTLLEIYGVADVLTSYYRRKGFLLASVTVPAQEVNSGTVRFEVIEGRLGKLRFQGNQSYSDAFLSRQLRQLVPGEVLLGKSLEQALISLNDFPGLTARSVVMPGADYGHSDILIESEEDRLQAQAQFNNYGLRSVGEWRLSGNFLINNPTRRGDQLGIFVMHAKADQLDFLQIDYSLPVNSLGTRLAFSGSRNIYKVDTGVIGSAFSGSSLKGAGTRFSINLTHPLIRSYNDRLVLGAGLSRTDTRQKGTGLTTPSPDVARTDIVLLELSALWNHVYADGKGYSTLSGVFITNFRRQPNFDDVRESREAGLLQVDALHLRRIGMGWSLLLRAQGAYSIDPLPDLERYRIGGRNSVRAFASGELGGDAGATGTIEFQHPLRFHPTMPIEARVFFDAGAVYRKEPVFGESKTEALTGVGVGATVHVTPDYALDLELTTPTNPREPSDHRDGVRIWAGLSAQY